MSAVKAEEHSDDVPGQDNVSADASNAEAAIKARLARKRTKSGCLTCRRRRIKCDEGKPICRNCQKSRRQCEGYNQRVIIKPADFQYLGPYGAATITFHTSMLPGVTNSGQDGQIPYGQTGLRAPEVTPQGYAIYNGPQQHAPPLQAFPGHQTYLPPSLQPVQPQLVPQYHGLQQWNVNTQPQLQGYVSMAGPQVQVDPYMPSQSGAIPFQTLTPHGGLPPAVGDQFPMHFVQQEPQGGLQAPLYSWQPNLTPVRMQSGPSGWTLVQTPPDQVPDEVNSRWQTGPSRVTISQTHTTTTATTVQHEWPVLDRPGRARLIDHQQPAQPGPTTTQFQANQLYEQAPEAADSPPPQPFATSQQAPRENVPSHVSLSPARLLEDAAIEQHDDDYYDIDDNDERDLEISSRLLGSESEGILKVIVAMSGLDVSLLDRRGLDTFIYDGILDTYRPENAANPLRNPATARVFAHFITATGPLLTTFVRQTRISSNLLDVGPLPLNQQGLWTYIMPMAAMQHQGLLQAILAISSLHIAKLQHASETPSYKHYGYALKRIHRSVRNPAKRHSAATLAATLLLGYYEIMAANHTNWSTHLAGARQLVIETDFASMTRKFKSMKAEKAIRDRQYSYYTPDMPPLLYNSKPHDVLLDQVPDIDEAMVSLFAGKTLRYDEYGRVLDDYSEASGLSSVPLDIADYQTFRDLFWWYCKQDVYQSIISGNTLLMSFDHWTDCPPRSPINQADAVYGSSDYLVILLGRVADFATRDRKRKLKVMEACGGVWRPAPGMQMGPSPDAQSSREGVQPKTRGAGSIPVSSSTGAPSQPVHQANPSAAPPQMPFFGMAPPQAGGNKMPASYHPSGFGPAEQAPTPSASPPDDHLDLSTATENSLREWADIKTALDFFASSLGSSFQPLGPEYQLPVETPFGPAIFYRSWDISCLWAIYNMCRIILIRAHPHMPPAAHMAAGVSAFQTKDLVLTIGRIAAGVPMPPPGQIMNPKLAAAVCDLAVPLFFAGIQYQAKDQRTWLVERLYSVDIRAGWATAGIICEGCQRAWVNAAAAGRGPPHERIARTNLGDNRVYQFRTSCHNVQGQVKEIVEDYRDRRFTHTKAAARLHWGIGIYGESEDLDTRSLDG